jgi:hypothetical protein
LKLIETTDEDVDYFEKVVNCIDEVDTTDGQTFRFPESIKSDKHLAGMVNHQPADYQGAQRENRGHRPHMAWTHRESCGVRKNIRRG